VPATLPILSGPGPPNLAKSLQGQYVYQSPAVCSLELTVVQGFYDVVKDELIEPRLTGISFSFTEDGHFEEAFYRAVSNR
jgi:hypothetical protein